MGNRDEFLDRLVGTWELTGTMGAIDLRQKVVAQWVVQGRFLRMHFLQDAASSGDGRLYEAIYIIGHDGESGEYDLHLFDTFGASYSRVIGVGVRRGDSVEFLFQYPQGPFKNRFTWNSEAGSWRMLLRQKKESGDWEIFARKQLSRG